MENDDAATSTAERRPLSQEVFYASIAQYIDHYKPDPILRRQIQQWTISWTEATQNNDDNDTADLNFQPSHAIRGELEVGGEHVVLRFRVICAWHAEEEGSKDGSLKFTLSVRARFWTKHELKERRKKNARSEGASAEQKDVKTKEKIRTKMIQRLRKDSYLSKLLPKKEDQYAVLCEAVIHVKGAELEERVDIDDDIAEGARRAVLSSTTNVIDLIEVLLALPYLPSNVSIAQRAKLRLLEDAMIDQCEKEGEGDLIDDLSLADNASKEDGDHGISDEDRTSRTAKKTKRIK